MTVVFEFIYPGFESRRPHNFFFIFVVVVVSFFLSILLQCEFNITVSIKILLLYCPYDAQASQRLQRFD